MFRVTAAVAAIVLGVAMLALPGPAYAQDLIVCSGSVTVHYAPPLGPLPQSTTQEVTERLGADDDGSCTGPFAGGIASTVFVQQVSCLAQGLGDTLVANVVTYNWHNGQFSTITYTVTTVVHAANQLIVTSTGTVTSGYGQGRLSERIAVYLDLDVLSCLASSVDQQTGTLSVTIA
ncbi:MAG: hypothetical protein HOV77_05770 [Hamadaea sp.]|uniref:hypothetical protein n=1 Tax=Hamadaea sp. TaxID=2024425 RepID=UPI0017AEF816|nr:hypothetical protein [Hamadaea sp.]NUT18672.1 hypothetical protein [Hamadaea sp.]